MLVSSEQVTTSLATRDGVASSMVYIEILFSGMIALGLVGCFVWIGFKGGDIQSAVKDGHRAKEEKYLDDNFNVKPGMEKQYDQVVEQNQQEYKSVDNTIAILLVGFIAIVSIFLSITGY